jgi:hypothetical protein
MTLPTAKARYLYQTDPSHGWLVIPARDSSALGLFPWEYSKQSYQSKDRLTLYLEANEDAPRFIEAYEQEMGASPFVRHSHTNTTSAIRSFLPISGEGSHGTS